MHTGHRYTIQQVLNWTRRGLFVFLLIAALPTVAYELLGWHHLVLPWLPIALIGTAVAFLVGFKNNATYDRLWEARKIWGAIVNVSRTWAIQARDLPMCPKADEGELRAVQRRLVLRHMAWLTALRYQLRQPRGWESMHLARNREFSRFYTVPEYAGDLPERLAPYLDPDERDAVLSAANPATQLLAAQSADIRALHAKGWLSDYRHVQLARVLGQLYDEQGKCERIKNFPYPRQFATLNLYFVWIFIALLPFGMVKEFADLGAGYVWLTIPFSTLVAWVFHTMDAIGEASANPFEGGANDIPMAALSRTIEIDLLQMIGEPRVPEPLKPVNDILM
ncbi:MAG: multidrug transporter [Flavobacteriales bacterium]|nr:multidrug transporter [Flavobacteriales bacterium]